MITVGVAACGEQNRELKAPPAEEPRPDQPAMVLEVLEPSQTDQRVAAENPDTQTIEKIVRGLAWKPITFVILKVDEKNWIEGSGSADPTDGFSARYMKDGIEHIAARAPETLDVIVVLLQSYRAGDGKWQQVIPWEAAQPR